MVLVYADCGIYLRIVSFGEIHVEEMLLLYIRGKILIKYVGMFADGCKFIDIVICWDYYAIILQMCTKFVFLHKYYFKFYMLNVE